MCHGCLIFFEFSSIEPLTATVFVLNLSAAKKLVRHRINFGFSTLVANVFCAASYSLTHLR